MKTSFKIFISLVLLGLIAYGLYFNTITGITIGMSIAFIIVIWIG